MSKFEDLCLVQNLVMKAEDPFIFLVSGLACWCHFGYEELSNRQLTIEGLILAQSQNSGV